MARVGLQYSIAALAEKTGLSYSTIRRLESSDGFPKTNLHNIMKIKGSLEKGGATFNSNNGVDLSRSEP